MDRPFFESKMAEIDISIRNFGAELTALGTSLAAIEKCSIDARSKLQAIQDRRTEIMADFAELRAEARRKL